MSWSRSSYSDDDELDIHVRSSRHNPEYRRPEGPPVRYSYNTSFLSANENRHRRSSSSHSGHHISHILRAEPPPAQLQPLVINNRIYNEHDDGLIDPRDNRGYLIPHHSSSHSRSRSRPTSFSSNDYELEKTRRELAEFKFREQQNKLREDNEKELEHKQKELELKRLKEEQRKKDQAAKEEAATKEAIEKFKAEEVKRLAKEKAEKEEREKEYKMRMEEDLRKSGVDEQQIAVIMKKDGAKKPEKGIEGRPTYTRMSRRHLSIETLNVHRIEYEFDVDPDYILIKRWVPEYEQDFLWRHTREIRELRHHHHPQTVVYAIEGKKKKHDDVEFEFIRKKEKRKPSPSPLLTFLAGGKAR